jgi:hypothetical protein
MLDQLIDGITLATLLSAKFGATWIPREDDEAYGLHPEILAGKERDEHRIRWALLHNTHPIWFQCLRLHFGSVGWLQSTGHPDAAAR